MASAIKPGRKKKGDAKMTIPKHLLIDINKLTNWKPIGAGGCGQVFSVNHGDRGPLAVKKLGVSVIDEGRAITSKLKREACLLYDIRHPNIIQFTGVLWTPPEFGLAMPLVAHGSLDKFIEEYETGPLVKIDFLQQISVGLNYLHSLPEPVIHGDLKLGNILVDYGCVMKLADFGLSSWREYQTTFSKKPAHGVQGTITHVAPEMWSAPMKPQEPQDVYALGILSWELFAEKTAFEGHSEKLISHYVTQGSRPDLNDMGHDVPKKLRELVESCWAQEVKHRPAVHEIRSSLAEIAAPIEKDITRAKSELVVALNEDSGGEDEEHLRAKRDQERDEEEKARKEHERLLHIEEREREIERREKEEQRRREQERIEREKHKREEKEKMERLEKQLYEMKLQQNKEQKERERDQKERESEKLRRKEIEDQMRKQDEKMKQLIQERKQVENRQQEQLKHLTVKRDLERDAEETARKERERHIEEREREIERREKEEQRRREKHKKEEKEKMERLEKQLHDMKIQQDKEQKERERERKEIEDQMRKQNEKMKQLTQERKQVEKREQGKVKTASPLADYGSFSVKDSAVNSTIHLCQCDRGVKAYEDKVRAIRPAALVWWKAWGTPPSVPGVVVLRVDGGLDYSLDALIGGLKQAESRGHRSVAVVACVGWQSFIRWLSDHVSSRRATAATDIWVVYNDSAYQLTWRQELSKDARYQRIK